MQANQDKTAERLNRRQLRSIERELGIFLDHPKNALRSPNQQFGVYDENEVYVGDVCADGLLFSLEELQTKIRSRFIR